MKLNKLLIAISWLTLLPIIIVASSSLITYQILIPLEVCHVYNGDNFGTSPLCGLFPIISYFGTIFLIFGAMGVMKLVGIITTIIYFIRIFIHNHRQALNKWMYAPSMVVLMSIIIFLYAISSVVATSNIAIEEERLANRIAPSEDVYSCDDNSSIELDGADPDSGLVARVGLVVIDGESSDWSLIGRIYDDSGEYVWEITSWGGIESKINALRTCKNSNNQTLLDKYGEKGID